MNRLAILGASGHGKVVADIAVLMGWKYIDFFDDAWPALDRVGVWKVEGNTKKLISRMADYDAYFIAIGNNSIRWEMFNQLKQYSNTAAVLIHPSATVSQYADIKEGTVVMANAVINPFASVGSACIVNTGATIDHDCLLGSASHISPGANLAGEVVVGDKSWVGIGANVKQQIIVGKNVIIGAGSTVVNNIENGLTVVGIPAKPL